MYSSEFRVQALACGLRLRGLNSNTKPQAKACTLNSTLHFLFRSRPNEGTLSQVPECLLDLGSCIHHERAISCDRLVQGFAGNKQEANVSLGGENIDVVAVAPDDEPCVRDLLIIAGKCSLAFKHVGEGGVPAGDLTRERRVSRNGNIEIDRVGCDPAYRTVNAVDGSRNHANPDSAFDLNFRNLTGQNALVSWSSHLEPGGEVDPELESVDPFRADLGHLLMHDAAAGGHPLNVARSNAP